MGKQGGGGGGGGKRQSTLPSPLLPSFLVLSPQLPPFSFVILFHSMLYLFRKEN